MKELSRIIVALGAVVASTGLILYGVGASFWEPSAQLNITVGMMVGGVIAVIIGGFIFNRAIVDD